MPHKAGRAIKRSAVVGISTFKMWQSRVLYEPQSSWDVTSRHRFDAGGSLIACGQQLGVLCFAVSPAERFRQMPGAASVWLSLIHIQMGRSDPPKAHVMGHHGIVLMPEDG